VSRGAQADHARRDPALRALFWAAIGRWLFRWTFRNWHRPRRLIVRLCGARVTNRTKMLRTVRIDRPWNLTAGDLTVLGEHAVLRARRPITIGDRCVISQLVVLTTEQRDPAAEGCPTVAAPITIEDDVWVAADTLVLPGARIGPGAVVGARSLVSGELPPWMIAAGEPAVPRRPRELRPVETAP
jgi:putative colanic acid biosynthesis acetyltransferase WcaF